MPGEGLTHSRRIASLGFPVYPGLQTWDLSLCRGSGAGRREGGMSVAWLSACASCGFSDQKCAALAPDGVTCQLPSLPSPDEWLVVAEVSSQST